MSIGGIDAVIDSPPGVPVSDYILLRVAYLWPESCFQDADEDECRPVAHHSTKVRARRTREFFVYRDRAAAASWKSYGATEANSNTMLHFLIDDDPVDMDRPRHVTLVFDERTEQVEQLIRDIATGFRNYHRIPKHGFARVA
jgi:hypothetical protein